MPKALQIEGFDMLYLENLIKFEFNFITFFSL